MAVIKGLWNYAVKADDIERVAAFYTGCMGASLMFRQADLTPAILAESLRKLLGDPDLRARMGSAMKRLARPDAAGAVVDWCQAQGQGQGKR